MEYFSGVAGQQIRNIRVWHRGPGKSGRQTWSTFQGLQGSRSEILGWRTKKQGNQGGIQLVLLRGGAGKSGRYTRSTLQKVEQGNQGGRQTLQGWSREIREVDQEYSSGWSREIREVDQEYSSGVEQGNQGGRLGVLLRGGAGKSGRQTRSTLQGWSREIREVD